MPGYFDATDLAIFALDEVLKPTTLMLQQILILYHVLKIQKEPILFKPYRMYISVGVKEKDYSCVDLQGIDI